MRKVYIFGPIYLFGESYLPIYKKLTSLCGNYFDEVVCTYPDFWDSNEPPREFWDRTWDTIKDADLFIADCSSPSHGVGMELQMGAQNNIPVLVLARDDVENFDKSVMVLGLPNLKGIIRYADQEDLVEKLTSVLEK